MRGHKRARLCKCCGEKLEPTQLWVCAACTAAGLGAKLPVWEPVDRRELLEVARSREARGLPPLEGMSMDEISALAWLFFPVGYGSYGKLRGYVDMTGKLPPLPPEDENGDDEPQEAAEAGKQWRGTVHASRRRK